MCLRASDPAGHHGLDIMDGVDGGCAVGGAPGFVERTRTNTPISPG